MTARQVKALRRKREKLNAQITIIEVAMDAMTNGIEEGCPITPAIVERAYELAGIRDGGFRRGT